MQYTRLWKINMGNLLPIPGNDLDFEDRLETWIQQDLSIVEPNLAVIGRQVKTNGGGEIDILAMDREGMLVVIELKRRQSPREVTAQVLDYASCIKDIDIDDLNDILRKHLPHELKTKYNYCDQTEIEEVFQSAFPNTRLPDEFNSDHRMIIVASVIDDATERIVSYLSESHGVNINAQTFNYYKDADNNEYLTKSLLIPEEKQAENVSKGKRSHRLLPSLLQRGILKVNDFLYFKPALDIGIQIENPTIAAQIVGEGTYCLRRVNDQTLYCLSKLKSVIAAEHGISCNTNFGYLTRYEWVNHNGMTLDALDKSIPVQSVEL